ncbi:MAG: type IV secretion system DNA-binding domain-containing protein [Candidatus Paceibacterota bacterium]
MSAPQFDPEKITYFGEADFRNENRRFGIKQSDRTRHVYVIGKTGMGKSTLLENMAVQDIQQQHGMAFIDPHGKSAELLLDYVPKDRIDDVLYFAPFDLAHPISFNVMEDVGADKRHLVANGLMSAFKRIWADMWSSRMEYILNNTLLALLEYPDSTLIGVNRMFADKTYRKNVVNNITDVSVKAFWEGEYAKYSDRFAVEATSSIQNKIGQFVSNPIVRNLIGQPESSFDVRKLMDERKLVIVNLSKGRVGEDNANLIGSMLITKMYLAAMSRSDLSEADIGKLPNFYFFVDEFQSFANESFADILSEARKYKMNLTIAHQYIAQMTEEVRDAVFGNVGTLISFRVGATDAEYLEKEFAPEFEAQDLVNLGFAQIYLRLMINGIGSKPFSARTLPPISQPEVSHKEEIIRRSREQFARSRAEVEEDIITWHKSSMGRLDDPHLEKNKSKKKEEKKDTKSSNSSRKKSSGGDNKKKKTGGDKGGSQNKKKNTGSREKRIQEAMSLTQLEKDSKKSSKKKQKKKAPSKSHLTELRSALTSVLAGTENEIQRQEAEEKKKQKDAEEKKKQEEKDRDLEKEQWKEEVKKNAKKEASVPEEISPEELQKMLEI